MDEKYIINCLSSKIAAKGYLNAEYINEIETNIREKEKNWLKDEILSDLENDHIEYVLNNLDFLKLPIKNALHCIEKARILITAKNLFYVINVVFYRNEIEVTDSVKGNVMIHPKEDLY